MSLIDRLLGNSAPLPIPSVAQLDLRSPVKAFGVDGTFVSMDDPNLVEFFRTGAASSTGIHVDERTFLRNSAANRAVRLITSAIGMLPVHLFKTTTDSEGRDVPEKASDHPLFKLLHKKPNSWQTPFEFKSFMVGRALFEGVAYAYKSYGIVQSGPRRGKRDLQALIPIDPKRVKMKLDSNTWRMKFEWTMPDGQMKVVQFEDMFWFRSPFSSDGVTGLKLIEVASEAIGLAAQSERTAGRVMKNGSILGGVLEHPKALTEPAANRLRDQFEERHSSPENAGKWVVAEEGMKVVAGSGGTSMKDAQAIEQRKFQIEEIGRFLDIPRPLLMMDETSWGTGIEQLGLFLITYCLMPWFISIEEAISRSLLSEEEQEQYYAKFNEAALLRGSLKDQADFMSKALGSGGSGGWMTQNEVRDKFNMEPKEGGDDLPQPTAKTDQSGGTGEEDDETIPAPGDPKSKP